jgi:hypothetical protein
MKSIDINSFIKSVEQHFSYLVNDFGFEVAYEELDENNSPTAKFSSAACIIVIEADYDRISVKIKPVDHSTGIYVNLSWIVEYRNKSETNPLPNISFPIPEDALSYILQTYSRLLKIHCIDFLLGDFSEWKDLISYIIERMKTNYRTTTGLDLPAEAYQRLQRYLDA